MKNEVAKLLNMRMCSKKDGDGECITANPRIPAEYGLSKIHKLGNKMRFIVCNINAPTHKLSKFLVKESSKMKQFDEFSSG